MIKYIILITVLVTGTTLWVKQSTCEPTSFDFGNKTWFFPSTVADAVKKHKMSYKPPGYYYKFDSSGMEALLDYHFEGGDFDNENQPKEILYSRNLHSYVFRFDETPGVYDSLKIHLEQSYKKKFLAIKGEKEFGFLEYPIDKSFEYDFLTVSPCMTIGIKRNRDYENKNKIVVRFMYNLSLGKMGIAMGNY